MTFRFLLIRQILIYLLQQFICSIYIHSQCLPQVQGQSPVSVVHTVLFENRFTHGDSRIVCQGATH